MLARKLQRMNRRPCAIRIALLGAACLLQQHFCGSAWLSSPGSTRAASGTASAARLQHRMQATSPDSATQQPGQAADVDRRSGVLAMALNVFALGAGAGGSSPARAEVGESGNLFVKMYPVIPPAPSLDPLIRKMQAASWKKSPEQRIGAYLKVLATGKVLDEGSNLQWHPVVWGKGEDERYKFDILDDFQLTRAKLFGKILVDSDLTLRGNELPVYLYPTVEDRNYVQKEIGCKDLLEIPEIVQRNVEAARKAPFPEYVPKRRVLLPSEGMPAPERVAAEPAP
mmetsp:Transcript_68927/g.175151  ORF Transcript_68927/g.175151 Transcript_68927/m.175151 type:complete len:284 (-) Transcript_68927:114-965(-)